ncbi:MAG: restriction endonuclease subunit S [Nostoc sp.]|uniref:restriction endonuclease subunit S n=1 Tax=Nostoc sp. TaxID=1180 RepID=UPI002FFCA775
MNETQLPPHWKFVKLGDVVRESIRDGVHQTPTYINYGIPFIKGKDIFDNKVSFANCSYISLEEHLKISKKVKPELEDILLTKVGTVGNVAIIETSDNFSIFVQVALIKPKLDEVDSRFLMYVLHSRCGQEEIASKSSQSTMRFIGTQKIATIKIPLPPLPEQKTIAHTLRTIQKAKETRQRELELERERKAVLMQYLFTYGTNPQYNSFQKTRFGKVPQYWKTVPLEKCASIQTGTAKGRKFPDSETVILPYLRVANVQDGYLDLSEIKEISIRKSEVKRYSLQVNDVVLTEGGDPDKLGRGFIWEGQIPNCIHQNHIFAVRTNREILLPEYLAYLVQSDYGKAYFLSVAHRTTNLASINSTKLKAFPTLVPDISEQNKIVTILQICDRKIQALEKEIAFTDELFHAMLEQLMIGKISTQPLTETYV